MATEKETLACVHHLVRRFPNANIGTDTVEAYVEDLIDLPAEVLGAAVKQLGSTLRFFPTVAEIRETCHALVGTEQQFPTAEDAWNEIASKMGRADQVPEFSHPLIAECVRRLDWRRLNLMPIDDLKWERKRMLDFYPDMLDRAVADAKMLPAVRRAIAGGHLALLEG